MNDPTEVPRIPWKPIEPLPAGDHPPNGSFAALGALHSEWQRHLDELTEEDRLAVRQRSLRRLAIETGILERLYEIEWGLTLTLVAEGFARDVVERAGGKVDEHVLATLAAQRESLEMVVDFVRADRRLSPGFIKELHHAITRTQQTYVVTDALGRVFDKILPHGDWKTDANHVKRADGSILEYAPPEHVASEVDRLVEMYEALEATDVHPLIQAGWLHHRFVQIHPFADGNGRVARGLTLLVLERHHYPPLVIDRWHRDAYLKALDAASEGSLHDLTRLFIRLESAALTGELERPQPVAEGMSLDVAHTLASQLLEIQRRRESQARESLRVRALGVAARMKKWFQVKEKDLAGVFKEKGLKGIQVKAFAEFPPESDKTQWFRGQVIDSARRAGHYADFEGYTGWCNLRVRIEGLQLRYVASLHGAGRDAHAMAVTTFGDVRPWGEASAPEEGVAAGQDLQTTADAFVFVHTEGAEALDKRAPELEELLDRGLAEALAQILKRV